MPSLIGNNDGDPYFNLDMSLPIEDRLRAWLTAYVSAAPKDPKDAWDPRLMRECCRLLSANAETASVTYELTVEPFLCNQRGDLHGGAAGTILDNLTSTALFTIAKTGFLNKGAVSRSLTLTYLRPIRKGTKVKVEAEVVSVGRTMANVRGVIKTLDGKPCVTCMHDQVIVAGPKL